MRPSLLAVSCIVAIFESISADLAVSLNDVQPLVSLAWSSQAVNLLRSLQSPCLLMFSFSGLPRTRFGLFQLTCLCELSTGCAASSKPLFEHSVYKALRRLWTRVSIKVFSLWQHVFMQLRLACLCRNRLTWNSLANCLPQPSPELAYFKPHPSFASSLQTLLRRSCWSVRWDQLWTTLRSCLTCAHRCYDKRILSQQHAHHII